MASAPSDTGLLAEVNNLRQVLDELQDDIAAMQPGELHDQHIPRATDHLGEVVRATEVATTEILNACERLDAIARDVGGGCGDQIGEAVASIYQACNFQDITGQRVGKVIDTLRHIDTGLDRLAARMTQGAQPVPAWPHQQRDTLMEGPQLPGNALDQAAIDALLNG
jgi:chemotaxis protein CheZ